MARRSSAVPVEAAGKPGADNNLLEFLEVGVDQYRRLWPVVGRHHRLFGRRRNDLPCGLGFKLGGHLGADNVAHFRLDVVDEDRHGKEEVDWHCGLFVRLAG